MFYLSGVCASPPPGESAEQEVSENSTNSKNLGPGTNNNMTSHANSHVPPSLEALEASLEESGLLLTKKNVADDENFIVEIQEVFKKGYLPVNSLLALPVCWASAKLFPDPKYDRNMLLFDEEDSLDAAVVMAFQKSAQSLRTPAIIDVHRSCRIPLPPKEDGGPREYALLIFAWSCKDEQISQEKCSPDRYTTL